MNLVIDQKATSVRVPNTPEALFKAAGVFALAGLVLALLNNK